MVNRIDSKLPRPWIATSSLPGTIVVIPGLTEVHLRTEGSGDPVLFIHDFDLAGGFQWQAIAELMPGPPTPDARPGRLRVQRPAQSERGRLHTVVGQAETMLAMLEELGISKVSVVGAGMGGSVAAQMASLSRMSSIVWF